MSTSSELRALMARTETEVRKLPPGEAQALRARSLEEARRLTRRPVVSRAPMPPPGERAWMAAMGFDRRRS